MSLPFDRALDYASEHQLEAVRLHRQLDAADWKGRDAELVTARAQLEAQMASNYLAMAQIEQNDKIIEHLSLIRVATLHK